MLKGIGAWEVVMVIKIKSFCALSLRLALILSLPICLWWMIFPRAAEQSFCLGCDQPYTAVFIMMMQRGITDFASMNELMPSGLNAMISAGYTPYLPPAALELDYVNQGASAILSSKGNPVMYGDQAAAALNVTFELPQPGLFHIRETTGWYSDPSNPTGWSQRQETTKFYNFTGAEWLDKGYSKSEVVDALRYHRLVTTLSYASKCYLRHHNQQELPDDFNELETYIGVPRNPAGWEGVTLVNDVKQLDSKPGGLFVGWIEAKWIVRCNLGPEIKEASFEPTNGVGSEDSAT